jgi:hypothetical protein
MDEIEPKMQSLRIKMIIFIVQDEIELKRRV